MILEPGWLQHADPHRGRFRSLLRKSLENFLINAAERTHARKRGGEVEFVYLGRLDGGSALAITDLAQSLDSLPPERLFDLRWAVTVVEHALQRLREECESKGKRRLFHALSSHLTAERHEVSFAQLSTELGIAESAVIKQLHNLRQRYRSLLRDEVAHTVATPPRWKTRFGTCVRPSPQRIRLTPMKNSDGTSDSLPVQPRGRQNAEVRRNDATRNRSLRELSLA